MLRVVPVYLLLSADEAVPSVLEPLQERLRQIRVACGVRVSFVLVGGIPEGALVEVPEALLDKSNLVTVRPPDGFLGVPEVLVLDTEAPYQEPVVNDRPHLIALALKGLDGAAHELPLQVLRHEGDPTPEHVRGLLRLREGPVPFVGL